MKLLADFSIHFSKDITIYLDEALVVRISENPIHL